MELPDKPVVVQFRNGPNDGNTFRSDSEEQAVATSALRFYYTFPDAESIGREYPCLAQAQIDAINAVIDNAGGGPARNPQPTLHRHIYVLSEHENTCDQITLTFDYQGPESFSDPPPEPEPNQNTWVFLNIRDAPEGLQNLVKQHAIRVHMSGLRHPIEGRLVPSGTIDEIVALADELEFPISVCDADDPSECA